MAKVTKQRAAARAAAEEQAYELACEKIGQAINMVEDVMEQLYGGTEYPAPNVDELADRLSECRDSLDDLFNWWPPMAKKKRARAAKAKGAKAGAVAIMGNEKAEVNFFGPGLFGAAHTIMVAGLFGGLRVFVEQPPIGWQELCHFGVDPVPLSDKQWEWFHGLVKEKLGMDLPKPKAAKAGRAAKAKAAKAGK